MRVSASSRKSDGRNKKGRNYIPSQGPSKLKCAGYFIAFLLAVMTVSSIVRMLKGEKKSSMYDDDPQASGAESRSREMMRGHRQQQKQDCNCEKSSDVNSNSRIQSRTKDGEDDTADGEWQTPKIEMESHYKRVFGVEPFDEPHRKHWDLHNIPTDHWYQKAREDVDKCDLQVPDPDHAAYTEETTLVTALLDLKRGEIGNGQFQRGMKEYFQRLDRILANKWPVVIFIPEDFAQEIHPHNDRTHIVPFDMEKLKNFFPYWDRVEQIRLSRLWQAQAKAIGWLYESPQSRLKGYNPLVMSKMLLLREGARLNPFKTKNFMFLDAGHMCATEIKPGEIPTYEEHFDKFMVTHWPYGTQTEVHGFTDKAMHMYMNTKSDPLQIVRGGIFGGQKPYIECVTKVYLRILAQTLEDGYMGTEENILAIAMQRFPELFHGYDNNQRGNHGDNCASFADNLDRVKEAKRKGTWEPKRWIEKYETGKYKPGDQIKP